MDTRDGEQFNTTAAGAGPTRRNPIRAPRARVCVCVFMANTRALHSAAAAARPLTDRPLTDRPGGVGLRGEIAGGAGSAATGNVVVWRVRRGIRHRSSVTRARVSSTARRHGTAVISPGISKTVSFFPYVNRVGKSRAWPCRRRRFRRFSLVGTDSRRTSGPAECHAKRVRRPTPPPVVSRRDQMKYKFK